MPTFPPPGPIATFGDRLLAHDLPALPDDRRREVVAFTGRRIAGMPSPIRVGVGVVAVALDGVGRVVGPTRVATFAARRPLPVIGDYVRLVRSLAYTYVWEHWPDTAPDGAPPSRRLDAMSDEWRYGAHRSSRTGPAAGDEGRKQGGASA